MTLAAAFAAFGTSIALACAWGPSAPVWSLEKAFYDSNGNAAFLSPANDSRVNMMLLLADRRRTGLELLPAGEDAGLVLFSWDTFAHRITPSNDPRTDDSPGRCQTNASGAEAFAGAVAAAETVSAAEKSLLVAARRALAECGDLQGQSVTTAPSPASPVGRDFSTYLVGTRAFYRGDFTSARVSFESLRDTIDPWLRETGLYMVARTALNRAQSTMFDEYGSILPADKRDRPAAAAASAALNAYLTIYPHGRYSVSATGLLRRAYWLAGDSARLSALYQRTIDSTEIQSTARTALNLVQEIDAKMFDHANSDARSATPGLTGALLLATDDLMRMRKGDDSECCTPISAEEIEAQRARFGSDVALFDYIRAAHAFFVRHDAVAVLSLIPDASHQQRFNTLQFSRQVLRGLALDTTRDASARQFWIDLLPGATGPYQREAVELAIATHDERRGTPERVFVQGSPVTNRVIREVLLTYKAGPDLLRRQARDTAAPARERDVALYLLLSKGLQRGFYADFLRDVRLVPTSAPNQPNANLNDGSVEALENQAPIPLGVFARPMSLGAFGCPALVTTVQALFANSRAATPQLCLAEFFRSNGFDHFAYDEALKDKGLASTPPLFPGAPYSRQSVYQAVIADRRTRPNERAYALYRAIRCYAPSGGNDCGGEDVDVAQRRAWFRQLKTEYANSRWAKSSDLYW
jgi:hypothetical protein